MKSFHRNTFQSSTIMKSSFWSQVFQK